MPGSLTAPQFAVLDVLLREPGVDQRTLGERVALDKATTAGIVARLTAQGLVVRVRDSADGRRTILSLSVHGRDQHTAVDVLSAHVQRALMDPLSADEEQTFLGLLQRVARVARPRQVAAVSSGELAGRPPARLATPGHLIRRAQQQHARLWLEQVPHGETTPQFAVLDALAHQPHVDQRTLGHWVSLDKATTAGIVGRLSDQGLVLRERDSVDGRRNLLSLSARGQARRAVLGRLSVEVQRILVEPLNGLEREEFLVQLRRVARLDVD